MIPKNINYKDIIKAIEQIQSYGVPSKRQSTKYNLLHEGEMYPPKYVLALANVFANGQELLAEDFSGGREANSCLENLGFQIVGEPASSLYQPIKVHSWEQFSETIAVKQSDKSTFIHNGTVIPHDLREFFALDVLAMENDIDLKLVCSGTEYNAKVTLSNGRTRLFWDESLAEVLRGQFPDSYESFKGDTNLTSDPPSLRFEKKDHNPSRHYDLEFISKSDVQQDVEAEMFEEGTKVLEGTQKEYYGKRYERSTVNRLRAIEIHGSKCKVCGFDFEAVYGERGRGFIEVHHVRPLYLNRKEQVVDPTNDLIPVCSNCHRMIHRRKDSVLTIEKMQEILCCFQSD